MKPLLTSSPAPCSANRLWQWSARRAGGKSSVARAGLVPRLRSDRRTAWETVILVPTDQPLKAIARSLVPLLEPTLDEVDRLAKAAKLAEQSYGQPDRTGVLNRCGIWPGLSVARPTIIGVVMTGLRA